MLDYSSEFGWLHDCIPLLPGLAKLDIGAFSDLFHKLAPIIEGKLSNGKAEEPRTSWLASARKLHKTGADIAQQGLIESEEIGYFLTKLFYLEAGIKKIPDNDLETSVCDVAASLLPKYAKTNPTGFERVKNWLRHRSVTPEQRELNANALLQAIQVLMETNQLTHAALALSDAAKALDLPDLIFGNMKGQCGSMRVSVRQVAFSNSGEPDDAHLMLAIRKSGSGGRVQYVCGRAEGEQPKFLQEIMQLYGGENSFAYKNCQNAAASMAKSIAGSMPLSSFMDNAAKRINEAYMMANQKEDVESPKEPANSTTSAARAAMSQKLGA